jgi:poly-gamma-glutamate synthesis protein (capsule biosynthesis protein)
MDPAPHRRRSPHATYPASRQQAERRRARKRRARRRLYVALAALVLFVALAAVGISSLGGSGDATAESAAVVASPSPKAAVTVTGGGDVMGDRTVRTALAAQGSSFLVDIKPIFAASDFGFINLESPLTNAGDPEAWKDIVFRGDPRLAPALAQSGVNVVTMANNHAVDQGDSGLLDTLALCQKHGIAVVGAGPSLGVARRATIVQRNGLDVAFLGYTDVLPSGYPATPTSPGTAPGRSDPDAVQAAIAAAAARADYTFVAWHWNLEFTTAPGSLETSEAKAAIDAGADVVFAHHPHVLQGLQEYNGGLICYSLGDLVFDNCTGPQAQTVLVTTTVSEQTIEATLTPVQLDSYGKPSVATGANGLSILQRVKSCSAELGTTVKIADGKGLVTVTR